LIAASNLKDFAASNPGALSYVNDFIRSVAAARWATMANVLAGSPTAKVLNGERVRFALGGGKFRLVASINFKRGIVFVKFIGTHQAYDRIDALTVDDF
jgi:mRNA interferase HigB